MKATQPAHCASRLAWYDDPPPPITPPTHTHTHTLPLVINCQSSSFLLLQNGNTQTHPHKITSYTSSNEGCFVLFLACVCHVLAFGDQTLELHLDITPWVTKSKRSHPTVSQSQCPTTVVSDSNKDGTGTQWDRYTYRQAHNGTGTHIDRHTMGQVHI